MQKSHAHARGSIASDPITLIQSINATAAFNRCVPPPCACSALREGGRIILPAGHYHETEKNLQRNNRIQVLVASRSVKGSHGPGQGCVLRGTGIIVTEGEVADRAKAVFPWARGALVIEVQSVGMQL
jgi:hypothetical protein